MARKAKAEAEKTRTRILASALSLFVKKGYERTTFTDIAARLKAPRRGSDRTARSPGNPMDLGKRIMASRNPNYRH